MTPDTTPDVNPADAPPAFAPTIGALPITPESFGRLCGIVAHSQAQGWNRRQIYDRLFFELRDAGEICVDDVDSMLDAVTKGWVYLSHDRRDDADDGAGLTPPPPPLRIPPHRHAEPGPAVGIPSMGRIVRYVLPDVNHDVDVLAPVPSRDDIRPAMLTEAVPAVVPTQCWNMVVFDVAFEGNPVRHGAVCVTAAYDPDKSPGTWHWPERS